MSVLAVVATQDEAQLHVVAATLAQHRFGSWQAEAGATFHVECSCGTWRSDAAWFSGDALSAWETHKAKAVLDAMARPPVPAVELTGPRGVVEESGGVAGRHP